MESLIRKKTVSVTLIFDLSAQKLGASIICPRWNIFSKLWARKIRKTALDRSGSDVQI